MSYLGSAEEEFDGLMQVTLSNFCPFEQSRARAHLKNKFVSELRLPSHYKNQSRIHSCYKLYKSGRLFEAAFLELLNCVWHHSLYFTTVCTPQIWERVNLMDGFERELV